MRVCLVGGIFGAPAEYRRKVLTTPELVLRAGLAARGHQVEGRSHYGPFAYDGFDVVHVHHLSYAALVCASDRLTVPFVFTPHAGVALSPARHAAMSYVARRADVVVALSQTEVAWQREHFGVREDRQHVIPNGVDQKTFRYVPPALPGRGPWRLLYVGQLIPEKGVHDLLEALAALPASVPVELDLVYHVADEEFALQARVRELGLTRVRFQGAKTPQELSALYAACHALVLPSYAEALPSVISEALLTGRPVVATRVGACEEQVADFGRTVAAGSVAALTEAIGAVLEGYESLARRAEDVSRSASRRFSVDAMLERHEALYRELLARSIPISRRRRRTLVGLAGRQLARLARARRQSR
jgi:glycosyltransferase involved in cell wall biosynthesis